MSVPGAKQTRCLGILFVFQLRAMMSAFDTNYAMTEGFV